MNILYILYFIFLYSSMILTRTSMNTFRSKDYWNQIVRYNSNMNSSEKDYYVSKTYHILYWLNADRFYWNSGDLQNLAEAFFAMGNVASICRICFLLPIIGFVGPLQVKYYLTKSYIFLCFSKVMLERMIIDISKWIVIILIFFIAFACSLFLIFSYFAVSLQQHNALHQPLNITEPQLILITKNNFSTINKCPTRFYELTANQPISYLMSKQNVSNNDDDDDNNTCKKNEDYSKIKKIGKHPAISYFGRSFGATILTTFFTLFGVIAEDNIPVNKTKFSS